MRLKSRQVLRALMAQNDFSLARLARYAGCSKGFIHHLTTGYKTTCTPQLGDKIAEALGVPTNVLFDLRMSPTEGHQRKERGTAA